MERFTRKNYHVNIYGHIRPVTSLIATRDRSAHESFGVAANRVFRTSIQTAQHIAVVCCCCYVVFDFVHCCINQNLLSCVWEPPGAQQQCWMSYRRVLHVGQIHHTDHTDPNLLS